MAASEIFFIHEFSPGFGRFPSCRVLGHIQQGHRGIDLRSRRLITGSQELGPFDKLRTGLILSPLLLIDYSSFDKSMVGYVSENLKMFVGNTLSDGGDEFLRRENLEVPLVAPMAHGRAVEDLAGILQLGNLLC